MSVSLGRNPEKVMAYVTECINLCIRNRRGIALEGVNAHKFNKRLFVLGKLISISSFPANTSQKRYLISHAIGILKDGDIVDKDTFINHLETLRKQHFRKRPQAFYILVHFPLNRNQFPKRQITIDGVTFKVLTLRGFHRTFGNQDFPEEAAQEFIANFDPNHLFLYAQHRGRDFQETFEYVYSKFEIMRGLFNFAMMYGRGINHFGKDRPISFVGNPNFYLIFNEQKNYLTHYYSIRETYRPILSISESRFKYFEKMVRSYNLKKNNDLKRIFGTTLQLYVSALDMVEKNYSFLYLWQVLEVAAIKDEVGLVKGEKVLKRVKAVYKNNKLTSDIIDALYEKRNKFVHGSIGDDDIEDDDITHLRKIAHGLILFLFNQINSVESPMKMTYVYDNLPLMKKELNKKIEMIKLVEQLK